MIHRPRIIVAGTGFGRVYLSAFRSANFEFELAGILARGSERSRLCAERYSVPLFTDCDQVPSGIHMACVVVGGEVNGGNGTHIAEVLMSRGIHVLQEHPLHPDEVARCLRQAHRCSVVYQINTHYVHVLPVRQFIAAVRKLAAGQRPIFIDAAAPVQTLYTLLDIIGKALGRFRPWALGDASPAADHMRYASAKPVFRTIDGVVADVPLTLRVQNQLQASDPNNYTHFFHRITIGFEGGNLTLLNTHGPIVWCPRPHMPPDSKISYLEDIPAAHLDFPTATLIGPAESPSYRKILSSLWPEGVRRALRKLRESARLGENPLLSGQYYLTLAQIWQELSARIGPLELLDAKPPTVLPADDLVDAAAAVNENTLGDSSG